MSSVWESVGLARHAKRPLFLDYVSQLFTEFDELHGDRAFADDRAVIGGLARFNGEPVLIIGQHRGRSTRERIAHNFGMAYPEGYRKAIRLVKLAERFNLPVMTFIDTQGAYPGVGAEERGQAQAIAESIATFSSLKTPIIVTIIGEGGSGGALAIGVGDKVNMLEHSIYSVISPEGCASILWKTAEKAPEASEALKLNASNLYNMGLIDAIIPEGEGAHVDAKPVMEKLQKLLTEQLAELKQLDSVSLVEQRYQRLKGFDSTLNLVEG
ncbi:acetyl-CoA carboxylase carboxyltransferase subunit alpha [Psychrobacter sp. YP14]|uniref:Acetyl-coenzyme A carboxylase carboxyl transferase subunit alpha n=3 Tax=Psychrobacter TaxID=497 RepID=A0A844LZ33_9GAMM|nr:MULTISPECIES: acetyl-CoA carboxylase carboxyltransferase subunit alpha [Psychrobacter]AWT48368.1 acetyl-CoA carboxylase carboxyltransferase subunit alpha [Psychrobacter sp. YP14]MUG31497.1 acetyl-CoA carboxylase carboxyltransferase subunit alpha [Psychrobacter sanguinis]UNK05686.1 acetyl-CoA carboxylase carboxyltransferase subunit alpha [Psychrobacter sp. PraFG1]